jgi:peroxin-10
MAEGRGVPGLAPATPLDLVRAHVKDEYYTARVQEELREALGAVLDPPRLVVWQDELESCAQALYLGLTSFAGGATPGEEYCDLVPVVGARGGLGGIPRAPRYAPGRVRAWAAVHVLLAYAQAKALVRLRRAARDGSPNARAAAAAIRCLSLLHRAHLALMYTGGPYLSISRRLFGLRFARYGQVGAGSGQPGSTRAPPEQRFDVLAALIWMQIGMGAAMATANALRELGLAGASWRRRRLEGAGAQQALACGSPRGGGLEVDADGGSAALLGGPPSPSSTRTCALCCDVRRHPAATPCGHLFCWACITEWAQTKPECAVCRQPLTLGSIVTVMHYD